MRVCFSENFGYFAKIRNIFGIPFENQKKLGRVIYVPNRIQIGMQIVSQSVALDRIPGGSTATVVSLHHEAEITCRLLELGVTRGTDITVLGKAPLGDPMIIRVRGCQFAIRMREAEHILVRVS